MNTKLHAVTDAEGRPIRFYMTADRLRMPHAQNSLTGTAPLPKS